MSQSSEEMDVVTAKWNQNFLHLRDHLEEAISKEDEALSKFDAQWKDLKRQFEPSEAPSNGLNKDLRQSESQKKRLKKKKQLGKQLKLMSNEPETESNEPSTVPGSLIIDAGTVYSSEETPAGGQGQQTELGDDGNTRYDILLSSLFTKKVPSQPGQEPVTPTAAGLDIVQEKVCPEMGIPTKKKYASRYAPAQATDTSFQNVPEHATPSNPSQATISEEDRVLLQLSIAKELLLQAQPRASNAAEEAKQTLRTWLSRDLETYAPEENFTELKEALDILHAQNQLPGELLNGLRKMFNDLDTHLAHYFKEKEELHKCRKFLTDQEEDLAKMKHGVQICQTCEAELEEYDSKIARVKAELAALEHGRAGVIEKIQGVMGGVEPIKKKLEQDSSQADQPLHAIILEMPDLIAEELFVWPWMGILANIKAELKDGSKLTAELARKGFDPVRVHSLWNHNQGDHSGFAVVEFEKSWKGFLNAMSFEQSFKSDHCGSKNFNEMRSSGDKMHGWVARADDYNERSNIIGDHLQRNGDLKTVFSQQAEEERETLELASNQNDILEVKTSLLKEMKSKCDETNTRLDRLMSETDGKIKDFNEAREKQQQNIRNFVERICSDNEKDAQKLEVWKKELEQREKQLQEHRAQNGSERRKLYHEKKMNERARLMQKKAHKNVIRLAEEQMREKEKLNKKIMELQNQLDAKQSLELEIERLRGALKVTKHKDEGLEFKKKKMDELQVQLREKEEELTDVEQLNKQLTFRVGKINEEVEEARMELISELWESNSRASIGVKRKGYLDHKPFLNATKKKYSEEEANEKAMDFWSLWEMYLRHSNWDPFKIVTDIGGNIKQTIDEEDEKLKDLKDELGAGVYKAVIAALLELQEYNPCGRYTIPELWNFKEGRKASLKEGVSYILKQWKLQKKRRR